MNMSDQINELAAALSKAQGTMQAAIKDSINPFFKSKYADLGSVWDAARPVLSANGLSVMQFMETIDNKMMLCTLLAHSSGQWIKSYLPVKPKVEDSQGIGAAMTYMRRYGLSAMVGVVCDDEDDGETAVGRGKQNDTKKPEDQRSTQQDRSGPAPSVASPAPHSPPPAEPKPAEKAEPIKYITPSQVQELERLIHETDENFRINFTQHMVTKWMATKFEEIPERLYEIARSGMERNINENKKSKEGK